MIGVLFKFNQIVFFAFFQTNFREILVNCVVLSRYFSWNHIAVIALRVSLRNVFFIFIFVS